MAKIPKVTLYKYVSTQYASDLIANDNLYVSDGSNYNDPFDMNYVDVDTETVIPIEGLRILCLTNSPRNKLMWSHYANSHKGVCLTVEVPAHIVRPVCYTGHRLRSDSDVDNLLRNRRGKCKQNISPSYDCLSDNAKKAYIKDRKWNYENEYRIVFEENACGLVHRDGKTYMSAKIKNVYLGTKFSENDDETRNKILTACREGKKTVKQMYLSNTDYSLKVREVDEI